MRAVGLVVIASLSGGCLSTPPQADDDDDDDPIDAAVDARADAGAGGDGGPRVACNARDDFTAQPLPATGLGVYSVLTGDVNNDGFEDLLLARADAGPANWGVYVLLGPQSDPEALVYHAFIPTVVSPDGLALRDVIRDTGEAVCPELFVLGSDAEADDGALYVFAYDGGRDSMYVPGPIKPLDFAPVHAAPVMISFADLLGEGADDVIVGDLSNLRVFFTGGDVAANLETATSLSLGPSGSAGGTWYAINAIFAVPRPGVADRDDLVIVENFDVTWLTYDGVSAFTQGDRVNNGTSFASLGLLRHDLDGVPPDDIVSAGGARIGGYLLDDSDGVELEITQVNWESVLAIQGDYTEAFAIGDLGGSALPELAIVDGPVGEGTAEVFLLDGFHYQDFTLEPTTAPALDLAPTGVVARFMVWTTFDGAPVPHLWLFAPDGGVLCVERNPAAAVLRLCQ